MAKIGRPPKYETPQAMQRATTGVDIYSEEACAYFGKRAFENEKIMGDFVERNIAKVMARFTTTPIESYDREYCISGAMRFGPRAPRVDFRAVDADGVIWFIELKNPTGVNDCVSGVSQLLGYSVLAEAVMGIDARLVYIVSRYLPVVAGIIQKYDLPIHLMALNYEENAILLDKQEESNGV